MLWVVNAKLLSPGAGSLCTVDGSSRQGIVGHKSTTIALDRYGHLFENLADQLARRMEALRETASAASAASDVIPLVCREAKNGS